MAKGIREKIKLVSSAGTGHFYTTTKNKRTKPEKMELKSTIRLYASTLSTKKLKSNNFRFLVMKTRPGGVFYCHYSGKTPSKLIIYPSFNYLLQIN